MKFEADTNEVEKMCVAAMIIVLIVSICALGISAKMCESPVVVVRGERVIASHTMEVE